MAATYSADIVWACAVAVDEFNQGYFKEDVWNINTENHFLSKRANKKMVREMLAKEDYYTIVEVTDEHIEEGRVLRNYFNGYLLREIAGKINDFEKQALKLAQQDEFTNRSILEFSIISCLPNSARADKKYNELKQEIYHSTPLVGNKGDEVIGELTITRSKYNHNYDRYSTAGRFGGSFVDFWFKKGFEVGEKVNIKGRIKAHRPDNTTQLHYVKIK